MATGQVGGRPVLAFATWDNTLRVWDPATRAPLAPDLPLPDAVQAVAVAPTGDIVVAFGPDVAVLSPRTGSGSTPVP